MRCEVCGRKIHSDPLTAIIEGAKLTVCIECSKHGRIVTRQEEDLARPKAPTLIKPQTPVQLAQKKKPQTPNVQLTQEITEDYATQIRVAREKLGLSVEDLGLKISERASVLRHIENGKMEPNNLLASKLERALKIKLLVPITQEKTPLPKSSSEGLTLGDLIEFKDGGEEPEERKLL